METRGAALWKVVLWSAEEVLAGGEIVWVCEGWIIKRLCGEETKSKPGKGKIGCWKKRGVLWFLVWF